MKTKRILSFLLVLCMMMSLMSVTALAEDPMQEEAPPPPHEHSWDGGVTTAAGCTTDGATVYSCTGCGETSTTVIPATGHGWSLVDSAAPSCTEDGFESYECGCGATKTDTIPATGHGWTLVDSVAPTCTDDGSKSYECACSATKTDIIPATGHGWTLIDSADPSCTEDGFETYECACSATKTDTLPATGHSWDEGTVSLEASYEADGVMTYSCTVCGDETTDTIPKIVCSDCKKFCNPEQPNAECEVCAVAPDKCKGEKLVLKSFKKNSTKKTFTAELVDPNGNPFTSAVYNGTDYIKKDICLSIYVNGTKLEDKASEFEWTNHHGKGIKNVGSYNFEIKPKTPENYSTESLTLTFTVSPAPLTITANSYTITYGDTLPTLQSTASGLVGAATYSVDLAFDPASPKDAGTYKIKLKQDSLKIVDDNINNYSVSFVDGSLTINKAEPTVTAPTAVSGLKYNGEAQTLIKAGSAKGGTISYSLSEKGSYSGALPSAADAGKYKVWYKVTGDKNHTDLAPQYIEVTLAELTADDVTALINGLAWLPNGRIDPGNEHQRSQVLHVWIMYQSLSNTEKAKVPAKQYNWLYNLLANTDYAIINGNGGCWYEGRKSGLNFTAIDPTHNFVGVYVDGKLISSSNYSAWWAGDDAYDDDDTVVVSLNEAYLRTLSLGKHRISIIYDNGYAPGYFYVADSAGSPRTGDSANLPLWSALMLLSLAAIGTAGYKLYKKKEN